MRRSLILVLAVVLAGVFVSSAAATVRVTKRPGRVTHGDKASVTVVVSPKARCTIGVYYSTTQVRGRGLGAKTREDDHLDVDGRIEHEARHLAGEDRLRQVRQGTDERDGSVNSERERIKPRVCAECGEVADEDAKGWRALFLRSQPEDQPEVGVFCPGCAEREFG